MTKDQIILSINIELESSLIELKKAEGSQRTHLNGRIDGLRYARSLVMKFDVEAQMENEEEDRVRFKMDANGNLTRI